MYDDIAEFKRFYQTRLGQNVADLMRRQLDLFWYAGLPLSSAFLGYAQPFLDSNQPIPLGLMPARRGAASWPQSSSVRNCLVDPLNLPIPDVHLDRLLLVHALEFEHDPGQCLDECWRVLDGAGRLLVVVPNRSGLWAKAERTPFGHGRPYSGRQLRRLLQRHGFIPHQTHRIAFMPPLAGSFSAFCPSD
ncbi:class I SAM-dependent methyltransferase [Alphaproteobacteria bacterium]|nr:class I SAM-dependent methyltransferase [Alphaproteobacteria bacterium]